MDEATGNVSLGWFEREHNRLREENDRLKNGDGGGTSDGMEARVNRIEARLDKAVDAIGEVKVEVATLAERVSHLPSKGYIDSRLLALLALIAALVLFADRIKTFAHI